MHRILAPALAALLLVLGACGDDDTIQSAPVTTEAKPAARFEVVDTGFSRMEGSAGSLPTYTGAAEIEFSGSKDSGPVKVLFEFLDEDGKKLETQPTRLSSVGAKSTAYAGVSFVEVPKEPASIEVVVTEDAPTQGAGTWVPLEVEEVSTDDSGIPTVTGTASNATDKKLGYVTITCALYRGSDIIAAAEGALLDMAPNKDVPFDAAGWEPLEGIDEAGCSATS